MKHRTEYNRMGVRAILSSVFLFSIILSGCVSHKKALERKEQLHYKKTYHSPKREMRAAWIQTVHQGEYARMSVEEMQQDFLRKLDKLQELRFNAVFFQVRPESDAWYRSRLEPWSRFLTGTQGVAPSPLWDPMRFLIAECHKRGMEFHAWINPYRAAANASIPLAPEHPYSRNPEWFVRYDNQLLYNPALEQCRRHICSVVDDIVSEYDVDAIHMDDYFYPYPKPGLPLRDEAFFQADPRGFENIADWRRDNVNKLIKEISTTIRTRKPWVRFGISPFGIFRNKRTAKMGSETNGLQNYDDLYADILLWDHEGWVDYIVPQIYWEMGHSAADYTELVYWWGKNIKHAHYYVGQDIKRTMNKQQLHPKLSMAAEVAQGNVMWPANEVLWNTGGVQDLLKREYYSHHALIPPYTHIADDAPKQIRGIKALWTEQGYTLTWLPDESSEGLPSAPHYYVVYAFAGKEKINTSDPAHIVAVCRSPYYILPYRDGKEKFTYVVTPVSRMHIEGKGMKIKVKL